MTPCCFCALMVMVPIVEKGIHSTPLLMAPSITSSITLAVSRAPSMSCEGYMPFSSQEWDERVGNMLDVDFCGTKGW